MWWRSAGELFLLQLCLAACRMRSSACDTVPRSVSGSAFAAAHSPWPPPLARSTGSAADVAPPLLRRLPQLLWRSPTPHVCASSATAPRLPRCGLAGNAPVVGRGGLPVPAHGACVHAQVLSRRRVAQVLALAAYRNAMRPSTTQTASAPGISFLSRLNGWPARSLCRRFAEILTDACARPGADVVRYSFIAVDLHHLLLAGLPAHPCYTTSTSE